MILNDLGVKYSTDKSSLNHYYCDVYEFLFARFTRHLYINLLEVGIQFGCSMRMWREYFPYANITGIDCIDNNVEKGPHRSIFGNAYSREILDQLEPKSFHIIIDDGSHTESDQVFFVRNYPYLLSEDGLMIVEDVPSDLPITRLVEALPEGMGHAVIDLRTAEHNTKDSILFLSWRK